jgi:hypothetical protein
MFLPRCAIGRIAWFCNIRTAYMYLIIIMNPRSHSGACIRVTLLYPNGVTPVNSNNQDYFLMPQFENVAFDILYLPICCVINILVAFHGVVFSVVGPVMHYPRSGSKNGFIWASSIKWILCDNGITLHFGASLSEEYYYFNQEVYIVLLPSKSFLYVVSQ